MNFFKSCVISCFLIAGCNAKENSISKMEMQNQATKNKQRVKAHAEPDNENAINLKKQLLGSWTDESSENALFEVKQDSIYYIDQFKSYKYNLIKDSISIVYDDFTFEGQVQFKKDTLILTTNEYEPQRFRRFTN